MAITTVDGLIAGFKPTRLFFKSITPTLVVGRPQSLWGLGGIPGAGSFDTTLNGVTLSSTSALVNGQLPFYDPAGGSNTYLARFTADATVAGRILLCDRLWHNGGYTITSTGVQSSTTPTWPARDNDGTTNGSGVLLGLEISALAGAAAPTITVTYTNSAGTGSRTAGFAFATANSPTAGAFFPIALQAGDVGVKSMESIQLNTSWLSGTMNMVAYRVLAAVDSPNAYVAGALDVLAGGMSRMYDGTVPFLIFIPTATNASYVAGTLAMAQG